MKEIIIYGTCYGTTKLYAEELTKRTGFEIKNHKDVKNINDYQTIIYMGGLYAGGVVGMKKALKSLTDLSDKKIIIVTVGLADPTDAKNIETIREKMKSQLSSELLGKAKIFHLRGGIDYSRLSFMHKKMMSMVYKKALSVSEEEKTAEIRAMIETYNKKADFVDFNTLEQITDVINA